MAKIDPRSGVPDLEVKSTSHKKIKKAHEEGSLYTGHTVILENPHHGGVTQFSIGGSTLHEALTEIVGAYDTNHSGTPGISEDFTPPGWVASTSENLASLVAEHYDCSIKDLSEVSA